MDLTTRCPQCGTTFLASLDQLQLRKGYIRCVQCAHIFDGYEAVVASDATPFKVPVASTAQNTPTHSIGDALATPSVVRGRGQFTISDEAVVARPARPEPRLNVSGMATHRDIESGVADTPEHVSVDSRGRGGRDHYAEDRHDGDDATPFWRSMMSIVWGVLIIAGILVFAAQTIYVFRVQLAENVPVLRPGLERMCTALNCTVAYSRQADMIVITQSSLQQEPAGNDDASSDTVLLQLTMRNVHDSPQEWPMLILDLKDFSGALIARKHLPNDVYLPADVADTPFLANAERVVVLPLSMQGLQVNGYQLTAVFP